MTVIGSYLLTVYCENKDHHGEGIRWFYDSTLISADGIPGGRGEFVGPTREKTMEEAREEGWFISDDEEEAFCPHCVQNGLFGEQ